MMPDHWAFVGAAYGCAVVVLGAYWRRLVRLEREATQACARRQRGEAAARPRTVAR